jgi:P-type E1-E2 ATPase
MLPPKCTVVRDGGIMEVEAKMLVVGDVVKLETGNKIPADLRIFWNNGLKVE